MRCEYPLTWPLYRKWVMREQLHGMKLVVNLLLTVFGLVNLYLAFPFSLLTITQLSLAALCVYAVFFHWSFGAKNQYRRVSRVCGENWVRVIRFDENSLTFSDGPTDMTLKYVDLTKIRETPGEATLFFGKKATLVLLTASFTQGSWPECRAMLKWKTGK